MKNIFKKNQIIITALAIMIIIAGYLNFMEKKNPDNQDVGANSAKDYDTYGETAGDDITEGDMVDVEGSGLVADDETKPDAEVADGTNPDKQATDKTDEFADISDEDTQIPVTDKGEVITDDDTETSAPGEAILVSTTLNSNYFASAKLEREQLRAANKERFLEIINNVNLGEDVKVEAANGLLSLTTMAENENETETLLEAKGYSDAVVSISDGSVDVIINAASITEQDAAKIEDVVKRKTGAKSSEIHIQPVVLGE
jgi:stage III sporulation protein AH